MTVILSTKFCKICVITSGRFVLLRTITIAMRHSTVHTVPERHKAMPQHGQTIKDICPDPFRLGPGLQGLDVPLMYKLGQAASA